MYTPLSRSRELSPGAEEQKGKHAWADAYDAGRTTQSYGHQLELPIEKRGKE
jgi:hypothetical protein